MLRPEHVPSEDVVLRVADMYPAQERLHLWTKLDVEPFAPLFLNAHMTMHRGDGNTLMAARCTVCALWFEVIEWNPPKFIWSIIFTNTVCRIV